MRFEIRDSIIFFHDEKPGQHATLFHNGKKLLFRGDLSHFSDGAQRYAWAFELPTTAPGDHFAFATADREVFGRTHEGEGGAAVVHTVGDIGHRVVRLGDKPHSLAVK